MRKTSVTRRAFLTLHGYNKKYYPLLFLQMFFDTVTPYFNLWLSAEIVTALYEKRSAREIYLLIAVTLLGNLFIRVCGAILGRVVSVQSQILSNNEAAAFNKKTLSLDYDKLEDPDVRQHRRKITENAWINGYGMYYLQRNIETLARAILNIVFSLALFFEMISLVAAVGFRWLSIVLLLALIACLALNLIYMSHASKKISALWKKGGEQMLEENRLSEGHNTSGMDERLYRQQDILRPLREKLNQTHLKIFSEATNKGMLSSIPAILIYQCLEFFSYLLICFYCVLGVFPVGGVIKYVGYLGHITGSINTLANIRNSFRENEPFLKIYLDYFDIPNDMYQGSLAVEKRSDKKFDVSFRDVSFRYPGTDRYALRHIDLDVKVGERLAVVGMNGSGKTTFIKLLCRLYDPTEGEVFMNDFNVRKYDYRQYLDLFSVVFQDFTLLPLPLGNTVAAAAAWDTPKAERLLAEVGFGERYAQMEKGLDTPLYKDFDDDGVNISGGEAQKIALARALYKDAPFIILDEPTAALDPIAEAEIYAKFDAIVGDKTAIYISHRLSSCRFCDRIAVFDEGALVQIGTHEELLADETGKYYALWNAQAQYYTEKPV